jgi:hypothetical protein
MYIQIRQEHKIHHNNIIPDYYCLRENEQDNGFLLFFQESSILL